MPAKSRETFADAYDSHVWDVFGFFGYRVGTREEAEDLTQATFERALKAWHRFDSDRATARTWLMAIAHNLLIDHYRRGRVRLEPLGEGDAADSQLGRESAVDEPSSLDPELAAAIGALGDRDREVIALRYGGDLTGPEIAELTGLSLANVQQILSRTLRRLRTSLEASELAARRA
jgi:RNA polymerase sigma factor (sigma-70 family)